MHRRLSGLDTAFLCLDDPNMPMTMGALALFKPDHPVHPRRIAALLADRARKLPRLHESPRSTWFPPGGVAWSRCRDFAAADHVHTHCVRGRGREDRLIELVTGIMARPLDPHRPLWEIHVVAGLPGARFGLLIKLHHALTDGAGAAALVAGLLDDFAPDTVRSRPPRPAWRALTTPSGLAGLARQAVETLGVAGSVVGAARPATALATFGATPGRRRLATLRLNRDDILRIRKIHGGTTNDVVLAVLAGALRECLPDGRTVRALVPVNVRRDADGQDTGNHLSGYLCDLPVGEPDPVTRLRIVRARMDARKAAGAARGAGAVPLLAGRVPGALHRAVGPLLRRSAPLLFDTVITNVPVPDIPLRLDGAELDELYPIVPLAHGIAFNAAVSTYRNTVHIALQTAGGGGPDVAELAAATKTALPALHLSTSDRKG